MAYYFNMILEVKNFNIGSFTIPEFRVQEGDLLVLHSPLREIKRILFNSDSANEYVKIDTYPFLVSTKLDNFHFNIKNLFRRRTVFNYLKYCHKLPEDNINLLLDYIKLDKHHLFRHICGGNNRILINIEIASNKSKFIVVDVSGIDPLGMHLACKWLYEKTKLGYSAIIITFPSSLRKIKSFSVEFLDEKSPALNEPYLF